MRTPTTRPSTRSMSSRDRGAKGTAVVGAPQRFGLQHDDGADRCPDVRACGLAAAHAAANAPGLASADACSAQAAGLAGAAGVTGGSGRELSLPDRLFLFDLHSDQPRARGHLRHDAGHQPGAGRVPHARRLFLHALQPRRDQPLALVHPVGARGRALRHHRRAFHHPVALRPHHRHAARDLGAEPAAGGRRHHDLRAADRERGRAPRQRPGGRLRVPDLRPRDDGNRGGAAGRGLRLLALHLLRADRARHHAEPDDLRSPWGEPQPCLHADLRLRLWRSPGLPARYCRPSSAPIPRSASLMSPRPSSRSSPEAICR